MLSAGIADIAATLCRATGLALSPSDVERAIRQRMKQCATTRLDAYLARLRQGNDELAALTELLVVPETWFFRDPEAFAAAAQAVRELLARGRRPVSILSLPCATGEEPYSLAMALLDTGIAAADFRIEAIDISARVLEHAARGVYGRSAFRSTDQTFRNRYFARTEHGYVLNGQVRDSVAFFRGNLFKLDTQAHAGCYDIIFCRNLLIYFDEPTQLDAVARLHAMLRDDGMLFAGYAEVPVFHRHRFVSTRHAMAFGLRKASAAETERSAVAPVRAPLPRVTASASAPASTIANMRRVAPAAQPAPAHPRLPSAKLPDADGALDRARALADRGDFQAAGERLAEYLRHKPDCVEANLLYGLISERNGDLKTAENHVRRAVFLDPQHYQALCHLALLADKQGNAAGASAVRERAARVFRRTSGRQDVKEQ